MQEPGAPSHLVRDVQPGGAAARDRPPRGCLGRLGVTRLPVQQAFIDEQAAQCGYCTSGMVVSAVALLRSNHSPTEREVREALDRNLCRCGVHRRIVGAVMKAAGEVAGRAAG